jgi:Co/Zn/Cd efflux system component
MVAALGVWGTDTKWPDLIVAAIMAGLFLYSSVRILQQATAELRTGSISPQPVHPHPSDTPI